MFLLTAAEEMDIEKEVVVAVLNSVLRMRGSARSLAARAGVTPVYISNIRQHRHIPRVRTAEKIARALPLSREQQDAWLEHVGRIWELRRHVQRHVRAEVRDRPIEELVDEIKQAHGAATFARNPALAKALYRQVKTSAELLLSWVGPERDPVNYIELCFLMHEALSVLNRNDEGLWYGMRARRVADSIDDPRPYHIDRERLDFVVVNAIRAEAVAFHNLKLFRTALKRCEEAEATESLRRSPALWKPHLYRDTINALEGTPRFPITQAENLADQVRHICETRAGDSDGMLTFLIQTSLARAYVRHQNFKDAYAVLIAGLDRLDTTRNLGPLHQVIFLRTFARFYSTQGSYGPEWEYLVKEALRMASQAGLEHQLSEMYGEFGEHLENTLLNIEQHSNPQKKPALC